MCGLDLDQIDTPALCIGHKNSRQMGRIALPVFVNIKEVQAAYTSPAYLEARKIGAKYAKFQIFIVEGSPQ